MPASAPLATDGEHAPAADDEEVVGGALMDQALRVQQHGLVGAWRLASIEASTLVR